MNDHRSELESALALVREALAAKQPLNRYHARAVLLPLGALLAAETSASARAEAQALLALVRPVRAAWHGAVQDELEMAITEFVQSVDRRYLSRPDYDFRYTREARARIDDRLRAARELGIALPEPGERALARADLAFAPFADRA